MGRRPQGWRIFPRGGWFYLRFTWKGLDVRIPLGTRDAGEAGKAASREYAAVVSGRRVVSGKRRNASVGLKELIASWLASLEGELDPETIKTCVIYGRKYLESFGELDAITPAGVGDYVRARLRQVTRSTLLKERVFLRRFLRWCAERGHIDHLPEFPDLPKRAPGKRVGPQRSAPVEVSPEDIAAILERLPLESKSIGGRKWPVRARFAFAWETALRPSTISRLSVPEHWAPGSTTLRLDDEDDKARFGRELPLSLVAIAVLREWAPKGGGLIFGAHNFTKAIKRAAVLVLGSVEGRRFAAYDLRHGRAQQIADATGDLSGLAYLLGHTQLSTTNRYLRPSRRRAAEALRKTAAT